MLPEGKAGGGPLDHVTSRRATARAPVTTAHGGGGVGGGGGGAQFRETGAIPTKPYYRRNPDAASRPVHKPSDRNDKLDLTTTTAQSSRSNH